MPQKLCCTVSDVVDHGERVYSVLLEPESPAPQFQAGQFLHLALDSYRAGDFWPDSRVFSIASDPSERRLLRITYAVKGSFTSRMEAELAPGRQVWIKLPYGEFSVARDRDVCLLAGGTGITAFTGFLSGLPRDHPHQVDVFYGARIPRLLIYRPLLQEATQRCRNLRAHFLAEINNDGVECLTGRVEVERIWELARSPQAMTFYLSGPPEMLSAARLGLGERGVEGTRIVVDAWE